MRVLLILSAFALALAFAAPATAKVGFASTATRSLPESRASMVERAKVVADKAWGHPCATVRVEWEHFRDDARLLDPYAWGAALTLYLPEWRTASNCFVLLNLHYAPRRWRWSRLCTVMVHEYGHLAGHDHSKDPFNVMYPDQHPSLRDDGEADMARRDGRLRYVPAYFPACR